MNLDICLQRDYDIYTRALGTKKDGMCMVHRHGVEIYAE